MASNNVGPRAEERSLDDEAESLNTDARVLAYLRAAMLELGDNPSAMAVAMKIAEAARAKLQRKDPLRVVELSRLTVKRSL